VIDGEQSRGRKHFVSSGSRSTSLALAARGLLRGIISLVHAIYRSELLIVAGSGHGASSDCGATQLGCHSVVYAMHFNSSRHSLLHSVDISRGARILEAGHDILRLSPESMEVAG
jgi:hypothetical protein